ncbi:hypothetical protein AA310_00630 [Arthrobacter sp. YC-RL1]|uniref:hypothetical protein n=1 Tax=Arthrobacter sp. YC-RL1 TaxID=1652545 RepID=UPI00063DD42B|nr:hypothetical protein [Arthrobacter sp. YC-RL1]ALQ29098.1 hypothetical protein ATC04_00065 [Arthrobacter sp. YC-RL1]ALQ32186.1 hypothetical protein ATC04_17695 [Arthrobacter sp. YC-RL1]KLI90650.1 hypothetical protein AA310_00630 [Arthrobacter sp. YC-RL1]
MSDIITAVLDGAAVPLAFTANWLAIEGITLVRGLRRRNLATAKAAEAQVEAMEAMARSANEIGRKLASGDPFQTVFAQAAEDHAANCTNPNCPIRPTS